MKAIDQLRQHSTIITSFVAGAASALTAGYLYCRLIHRKGGSAPVSVQLDTQTTN